MLNRSLGMSVGSCRSCRMCRVNNFSVYLSGPEVFSSDTNNFKTAHFYVFDFCYRFTLSHFLHQYRSLPSKRYSEITKNFWETKTLYACTYLEQQKTAVVMTTFLSWFKLDGADPDGGPAKSGFDCKPGSVSWWNQQHIKPEVERSCAEMHWETKRKYLRQHRSRSFIKHDPIQGSNRGRAWIMN